MKLRDPVLMRHLKLQFLIWSPSAEPLEAWYGCVILDYNFQNVLMEETGSKYRRKHIWLAEIVETDFPLQTTH